MFPSPVGELHFSILYAGHWNNGTEFPSPVGELHFSIIKSALLISSLFPSPVGELHFSIGTEAVTGYYKKFPSPVGELHFSIGRLLWQTQQLNCFRPLSGNYISQ